MRTVWIVVCCGVFASSCQQAPEKPPPASPNLVIFLADDLGWNDVGYHGSEIQTPRIDALVREGVELDRFYAYPICSPTRVALMTGRSPISIGIGRPVPGFVKGLPTDEHLMPQSFRAAGYQTFLTGKWHLGADHVMYWPQNRGFDHFYGHLMGTLHYTTHVLGGRLDWQRNGKTVREEGYTTRLIADEAVRLIENRDPKRPVFLYVAFNAPHSPLVAPEETTAKYSVAVTHSAGFAHDRRCDAGHRLRAKSRTASSRTRQRHEVLVHSKEGGPQCGLWLGRQGRLGQ